MSASLRAPRGGQCLPWKARQTEVVTRMTTLFPTINIHPDFLDPQRWAKLVVGKNSKLTGRCDECGVEVCASIHNLITCGQGFKNCRCNALPKVEERRAARDSRDEPPLKRLRIDSSGQAVEQMSSRVPRQPWTSHEDFLNLMQERFPNVRLDSKYTNPTLWPDAVGRASAQTKITGMCLSCNASVSAHLQNLTKEAYQGFGTESGRPCACHVHARALERARQRLPAQHKALRIEMREGTGGRHGVQNHAFVVTRCSVCSEECATKVKTLLATRGPTCSCSGEAVWKGEAGYKRMKALLTERADTRHYAPDFDLPWWVTHVVSGRSKIPLRCTLCEETVRSIRISSIQQFCRAPRDSAHADRMFCGCVRDRRIAEAMRSETERVHLSR